MNDLTIRLRCTKCRAYREFDRAGKNTVRCDECGKRHSTDSLFAVEEGDEPSFE